MKKEPLHLFEGFGIELEYMLVDAETLAVKPLCEPLLLAEQGSLQDVERGPIGWSNELVAHLIELKTNGPAKELAPLPQAFANEVQHINGLLSSMQACMLPTAMHPLMNPRKETVLWPHGDAQIYSTFDRIFHCQGHGWSNLQSAHLNLPFGNDEEFGRLHAAIRLLLPILPALAASSPMVEGQLFAEQDARLHFYRDNALAVPSVSGKVVPEPCFGRKDYEMNILARIYQDMALHDPAGILQHEWVNARGAIARFDRDAIEIRLLDVQECPLADLSLIALIVAVLQALVAQRWLCYAEQKAFSVAALVAPLRACSRDAGDALITDGAYLKAFGHADGPLRAQALWQHLQREALGKQAPLAAPMQAALTQLLEQGCLSTRLRRALGERPKRARILAVYHELAACLQAGRLFSA